MYPHERKRIEDWVENLTRIRKTNLEDLLSNDQSFINFLLLPGVMQYTVGLEKLVTSFYNRGFSDGFFSYFEPGFDSYYKIMKMSPGI